jgi:NTE family protein
MRALVLSGGGSKGAYQVGALKYILGELKISYDIFCGVSVGAINCGFLSQFMSGIENTSITELEKLWNNINTSNIYTRWKPFGRLHAVWKKSFYDSSPLHQLIRSKLDLKKIRQSGKHVSIGTVSLSSGKYTIFDQNSDHFIEAVIASASFPGMLTPIKFMGQYWIDGGVKEISPIKQAIELGADVIDIIITSPKTRIRRFIEKPTTVDILKRCIDLSSDKIMANDIEKVEMHNKLAEAGLSNKRIVELNILRPQFNLIEDLLDFDPKKINEMMEKGYQDAKKQYIM